MLKDIQCINPIADQLFFSEEKPIEKKEFFHLGKFHAPILFEEQEGNDSGSVKEQFHGEEQAITHHSHHLVHGFDSFLLTTDKTLDESLVIQWLDWLVLTNQEQLYRFKGIVAIQNHEWMIAVQGVNQQVNVQMTLLQHSLTQIVLIGKKINFKKIQQSFDELCRISERKIEEEL